MQIPTAVITASLLKLQANPKYMEFRMSTSPRINKISTKMGIWSTLIYLKSQMTAWVILIHFQWFEIMIHLKSKKKWRFINLFIKKIGKSGSNLARVKSFWSIRDDLALGNHFGLFAMMNQKLIKKLIHYYKLKIT